MLSNSPRLWIVATPIGNPGDLSPRAQKILAEADLILAEDTRKARFLLQNYGIDNPKLLSFFEHNEAARQPEILKMLGNGANIALITDAGTPLLADPGYRLVQAARKNGLPVSPVPGSSAPVAALSAAGLPPVPYSFLGFMPRSAGGRSAIFERFAHIPGSIIFFERKNRLPETLNIAYKILGQREMVICRELTKRHEEFIYGMLANGVELSQNLLGELTVIIGPDEADKTPQQELELLIDESVDEGLRPRDAARLIADKCRGWSVSEIYELIVDRKRRDEGM